ncbi:MAG TPA: glycoside hydrolase family 3 C-terminal domain-containing protein [Terriglobia bacterium]|nr:glycoside hydrolase family 3 C-terminal domain-containing protein [Terriglobia bacterium]
MIFPSRHFKAGATLALFILTARHITMAGQEQKQDRAPYLDTSLSIEQRVEDLVARMTLQEKVLQMQHTAPGIPRLGILPYDWWNEALHGVARSGYATVFPQAIGMAATWDADLVHDEGRAISVEARAKYNQAQREQNYSIYYGLTFWSPNINIFRDPRWGRGQETYGEDPYLTGRLGIAFVKGLQGDNPKYLELVATPKHFAVHSGPETSRHSFNVNPSPRDLEATYLPAFRATIVEGQADSIMCVYNAIDGVPGCANTNLLQKTLRDDWHFQGFVTSDCGAVGDITAGHHYTPDNEHGSATAVRAGTDTTCGNEYVELVPAVKDGLIKESEIDTGVKRLFTARMRLGMFDPPDAVPFNNIQMTEDDSPEHRQLALRAARESMVLLKNKVGILPLKPGVKTIAVIGPNAESLVGLEGNYNGVPSHPVLPVDGIRKQFEGKATVLYAQGSTYVSELHVPVPRTVFHPGDGGSEAGLKSEYFAENNFSGQPVLTRTDPLIQFDWNAAAPAPGVPMQAFAVRWSGTLTPPGPGDYTFNIRKFHCYRCELNEGVQVFLDEKLMIDTRQDNPPTQGSGVTNRSGFTRRPQEPSFSVHFKDAKPHSFRLEYTHSSKLFGAGITFEWQPPADVLREEAVKVAQRADVVLAFVGLSPNLEGEEMPVHIEGFNGGDRTDISLPKVQQDLLQALGATGKPLVVVLVNGSALDVSWAESNAAAILEAWYPGEEGGTAIAETLAGVNNPGGRLPITFYASLDQLPPFEDYSMQGRTYRYFQGKPLYRFGYGLSYAKFAYSNLKLSSDPVQAGQPLRVEVDVRNWSKVGGDEVAELYIDGSQTGGAPIRELKGFQRIHLAAGKTKHVTFTLDPRDLSVVTEMGDRIELPGTYHIFVGNSQPVDGAQGAEATFRITGEEHLPH